MNEQEILEIMAAYFDGTPAAGDPESLGDQFPRSVMKESLEVVNFMIYLEDKTSLHVDITELGPAMLDKNFRQLATDLAARLAAERA